MARENTIEVEGTIVEVLSNRTYRVELANGHRVLAFVAGRTRAGLVSLPPGGKVMLELSPYDLSEGRIVMGTQTI